MKVTRPEMRSPTPATPPEREEHVHCIVVIFQVILDDVKAQILEKREAARDEKSDPGKSSKVLESEINPDEGEESSIRCHPGENVEDEPKPLYPRVRGRDTERCAHRKSNIT